MEKLFTLLEIQRKALEAPTRAGLLHIILNDSFSLVPYQQSVFWQETLLGINLEKASGNLEIEQDGPYAQTLKAIIQRERGKSGWVHPVSEDSLMGAVLRLEAQGVPACGLFLETKTPINDAQIRLLEELCITYGKGMELWAHREKTGLNVLFANPKKIRVGFLAALAVIFFFPVRMGVSGPAEIVARDSTTISAPYAGLIEKLHVAPGDVVKTGDLLVTMEDQTLEGQMALAAQELAAAQAAFSRLQRESLITPEKKPQLLALREDIQNKKIAYDYAKSTQQRAALRAPKDGVAVFSDSYSLRGKPIETGTEIMKIADTDNYELLIRIPVDSMIALSPSAKITYHLNTAPLTQKKGVIERIGYQASKDPDGLMTYKITARVEDKNLRIGWKGTARISDGWGILGYAILRRPINAFRIWTGL